MTNAPKPSRGSTPPGRPKQDSDEVSPDSRTNAPIDERSNPTGGAKRAPHYDDRPSHQRGGANDPRTPVNPKIPEYGDTEPQDPRRIDLDAHGRDPKTPE